ncbi:MAG: myxococcus cysteine-rich repeat containing protein [Candidatus Binatia bacterium]
MSRGAAAGEPPRRASFPRRAAAAALLLLLPAGEVLAHGAPIDLAAWGPFSPTQAQCQRVIASAAAACAQRAWRTRRECAAAEWRGDPCDPAPAIEQARSIALDAVAKTCSEAEAVNLQFQGVSEAQRDVVRFCRELEDTAAALVLDPIAAPEISAELALRCGDATARATSKLLGVGFRSRQRLFDRIASQPLTLSTRRRMVSASTAEIAGAATALAEILALSCPPADFAALYGRTADELLEVVARRADCLAGDTYAQSAVTCPEPVCGNGVRERDEECDDRNTAAGDGCSAACLRESGGA